MPVQTSYDRDRAVSHSVIRAIRPRTDQIKMALAAVQSRTKMPKKRAAKAAAYDSDLEEDD